MCDSGVFVGNLWAEREERGRGEEEGEGEGEGKGEGKAEGGGQGGGGGGRGGGGGGEGTVGIRGQFMFSFFGGDYNHPFVTSGKR